MSQIHVFVQTLYQVKGKCTSSRHTDTKTDNRHTYMHTHIYVHVQTLSDAMYQVANYHLLRKFLLQSRATGLVHQLSKGMSRGVEHEKKRVRSCEGKGFADIRSEMGGRQMKSTRTCRR